MSTIDERIAHLLNKCQTAWWYLTRLEKQIAQASALLPLLHDANMGHHAEVFGGMHACGNAALFITRTSLYDKQ
jgi:hypothetical protein